MENLKKMPWAKQMGLSLSALTKAFYHDLVKKKKVSLSANSQTFDHILDEAVKLKSVKKSLNNFAKTIQW